MLYIKIGVPDIGPNRWLPWHIGQPLPTILGGVHVISFQADGDELNVILDALRGTAAPVSTL